MKIFVLALILTIAGFFAAAQQTPGPLLKPDFKKLEKFGPGKDLRKLLPKRNGHTGLFIKTDSLRFSHAVPDGNVYLLTHDNMPCVFPKTMTAGVIPNAANTPALQYIMPGTSRYKAPAFPDTPSIK